MDLKAGEMKKNNLWQLLDPLYTYTDLKAIWLCNILFLYLQGMTGRRGPIGVKVCGDEGQQQGSCHSTAQADTAPIGMCQENRHAGFTSSFLLSLSFKFLFSSSGSSSCMLLPGPGAKSTVHMPGAACPFHLHMLLEQLSRDKT